MWKVRLWLGSLLAAGTLFAGRSSIANVVPFTWDPSQAVPSLTAGPATFTADNILLTNNLHSVNTNNFVTLQQSFVEDFIQPITGFTLHGSPVTAPGLNSSYGLYFTIHAVGQFPINGAGIPTGRATFSTLNLSLMADVAHDNGTASASQSGVAFSNPAGVANDVALATGTLVSAALSRDAAGVRHAHFSDTFVPSAGEAGFFVGPDATVGWEEFLTTLPAAFELITIDALTSIQLAHGELGSTGTANLIPEPASIAPLLVAMIGMMLAKRRKA